MPKIAVNEYRDLLSHEDYIRAPGQSLVVFAKSKASLMQCTTNCNL